MSPQQTIAHYRITAKLGEGGMGAVYRATDTRLNREVAVKVLPPAFAQDSDRMARFEREAKALASLNHPEWPKNSCGLSVVVLEKTAEAFVTADRWPSLRRQHFATWE